MGVSHCFHMGPTLSPPAPLPLQGGAHAQTRGLHHGWQPSLCAQEEHGAPGGTHAGLRQIGRGEPGWHFDVWNCSTANRPRLSSRHFAGASIWTYRRWPCMPSASKTSSALRTKWKAWWNWPNRNLKDFWRNGGWPVNQRDLYDVDGRVRRVG